VLEDFFCCDNNLSNLEGAPRKVGSDFDCESNDLTSFKGMPEKIGGIFLYKGNPISEIIAKSEEFRKLDTKDKKRTLYFLLSAKDNPTTKDVDTISRYLIRLDMV